MDDARYFARNTRRRDEKYRLIESEGMTVGFLLTRSTHSVQHSGANRANEY